MAMETGVDTGMEMEMKMGMGMEMGMEMGAQIVVSQPYISNRGRPEPLHLDLLVSITKMV